MCVVSQLYNVYGQDVQVKTTVFSNIDSPNKTITPYLTYKGDKQKTFTINVNNLGSDLTTSNVSSWYFNPFNPIKNYLSPERLRTNWSIDNLGKMTLYNRFKNYQYPAHEYKQMVAHEFGHILGLGDAYSAWYRYFIYAPRNYDVKYNGVRYPVDVPNDDIMLAQYFYSPIVTSNNIRMVWEAWRTGRPQFFPIIGGSTNLNTR